MEQSVSAEAGVRSRLLCGVCWLMIALLVLTALFAAASIINESGSGALIHWPGVVITAICLVLALILFRLKDRLRVDYDYIYRDGMLEVVAVLNRRRRRRLAQIDISRVQQCGPAAAADAERMGRQNNVILRRWYPDPDENLYCIVYTDGNKRCAAFLELNDAMIDSIKSSRRLPAGALRNPEGR